MDHESVLAINKTGMKVMFPLGRLCFFYGRPWKERQGGNAGLIICFLVPKQNTQAWVIMKTRGWFGSWLQRHHVSTSCWGPYLCFLLGGRGPTTWDSKQPSSGISSSFYKAISGIVGAPPLWHLCFLIAFYGLEPPITLANEFGDWVQHINSWCAQSDLSRCLWSWKLNPGQV